MKLKNSKFSFILFLSLAIMVLSPVTANAASAIPIAPVQVNKDSEEISPRAEDIRWVYKTIGTQTYRRRFNYTRNVWIGNWEPC